MNRNRLSMARLSWTRVISAGKEGERRARSRRKSPRLPASTAWRQGLCEDHSQRGIGNADADHREKVALDSIVYTDCWKGYDTLDASRFKHYRINHSVLFADRENHINGIENFWSQAKRQLRRHNGIPRASFPLYLKECEWRFNNPSLRYQLREIKQRVKIHLA